MNLFDDLGKFAGSIALIDQRVGAMTYAELEDQADQFGQSIPVRSLVICVCSNDIDFLVGYIGLQRAGHVCLMVSSDISSDRMKSICDNFSANYLWAPSNHKYSPNGEPITNRGSYELTLVQHNALSMNQNLAVLLGTSGSTGSPLMVRLSNKNLVSNALAIANSLNLTASDRAITTLPANYSYGLSIIHSQLITGGSIQLTKSALVTRQFWEELYTGQATYFGGVPYTYETLERLGLDRLRQTNIRMLTQAGGRLHPELAKRIQSRTATYGIEFYMMYGQTEATARMSVLQPQEIASRPQSVGKPIPEGNFRVIDVDSGAEVGAGEVGEIEYRGPNVMLGYASDKTDLERGDDQNGTLLTGDLGYMDNEGFCFIVGRKKRFIKVLGHRISLDDVESYLASIGICSACKGDDEHLEVFVEGDYDTSLVHEKVSNFVGTRQMTVTIRRIVAIPRSDSGKPLYSRLV